MLALSGTVSVAFEWRRPNPPGRNAKLRLPQRSDPAAIHGRRHKQGRIPVLARDTSGPLTFGIGPCQCPSRASPERVIRLTGLVTVRMARA